MSSIPAILSPASMSKVDRFIKNNQVKKISTAQRAFVNLVAGHSSGPKDRDIVLFFSEKGELPEMETTVYDLLKEARELAKDDKGIDFQVFDDLLADLTEEAPENVYPVLNEISLRYAKEKNEPFAAHVKQKMAGLEKGKFKVSGQLPAKEQPVEEEMAVWKKVLIGALAIGVGVFALSRILPAMARPDTGVSIAPRAMECHGFRCRLMERGSFMPVTNQPIFFKQPDPWREPTFCKANREWSKHSMKKVVERAADRMKSGGFGEGFKSIGDASSYKTKQFYAVPFGILVNQIQESTSFKSFRKHALPCFESILPVISEEVYAAVKQADVSQLDQELVDPSPLLAAMRSAPKQAEETYRSLAPLSRLYFDFRAIGIQRDPALSQAFYETADTHDYTYNLVEGVSNKVPQIESYTAGQLEQEIEGFLKSEFCRARELRPQDRQELVATIRSPRFHLVSLEVRERLLFQASFYGWTPILREILHAKGAEQFSSARLGSALFHACHFRDEEIVEILGERHFAERIGAADYVSAVAAASRYELHFDVSEQNMASELQMQTLAHLRNFPHLANLEPGQRREVVDQALSGAYYPEVRQALLDFLS